MVWKMKLGRRNKSSSGGSFESSPESQGSSTSTTKRLPRKGCLRTNGISMASSEASPRSSLRSETDKCCDQSSSYHSHRSGRTDSFASQQESLDNHGNKRMSQANQSLASGSTVSSKSKRVQFSVVEIRNYEREIGDNPSCSNGCPIGIGWTHLDSRVVHLNHFENSRPYRKAQLELVLTRDEREALLGEWGVHANEIVAGTRAVVKAKNQRRQTVQNLSKASVEESIEGATRKLKEMLSLKKSTKKQVRMLQRQAEIVATLSRNVQENSDHPQQYTPSTAQLPYPEIVDAERSASKLRPTGVIESLRSLEHFNATSALEDDSMDAISCISGFTLGNSTTASAREIEQFHQELEIELFGDQELPSMVGTTLEVDVEIPDEERIYHDPSPICGSQEPASVVSDLLLDESVIHQRTQIQEHTHDRHLAMCQGPFHVPYVQVEPFYKMYGSTGYAGYLPQSHRGEHDPHRNERRQGGSLGSTDIPEHCPTFAHPVGQRLAERIPYSTAKSTISWSSVSTASTYEEPEVSHVSLLSYLSPNHWMEGTPSPRDGRARSNQWEAVIISEEADDSILDGLFVEHQTEQYDLKAMDITL